MIICKYLWRLWLQTLRKKFRQKYGLFMQNKCLYMISSFLRKNNRHSWRLNKPSKTFQINGNLLVSLNCKVLLCLRNKNFLTEIYRNIQTFAFKVLQKCSSWASRNGAAQMFFSDSEQKHAWWKICKVRKVFDCVARAYYFQFQMSKVVWAKL